MDKYQILGLLAGQVLFGLGFGIVGAIVAALLAALYFGVTGGYLDLYGEIMFAVIGGYIGMQAGIAFDGYKFLRTFGRQASFMRFFLQSLLGLVFGLLGFYWLLLALGNKPPVTINFLAITLPLAGAIIGFDIGLTNGNKNSEKKEQD
jgi:hypothetical protein